MSARAKVRAVLSGLSTRRERIIDRVQSEAGDAWKWRLLADAEYQDVIAETVRLLDTLRALDEAEAP